MSHSDFITALGGTGFVASELGISDQQVSNWKKRGIAWRYRPQMAQLAKRRRVAVPDGFMA